MPPSPSPCYAALLRHLTLEAVPKPPSPLPSPPLAPAASPVASLLLASRDYFCNMPATVWVENDETELCHSIDQIPKARFCTGDFACYVGSVFLGPL